jgi:hypothetical protein
LLTIRPPLIALALAILSGAVRAQQPPAPSAAAQFASQLAALIVGTIEERDACRSQLSALQAAVAKPPQPPTPSPEGIP